MSRKLSEKQNELLSLTTRVDADLTQQQRILLGYIIYKYNDKSDSVRENGYTHDSRDTIKKECGIGSDTLKTAIVKLENEGLITCERGIAHKQNTRFTLTKKTLDAIASHEASYIASYTENTDSSLLEKLLNEVKTMRLAINELVEDNKRLTEEVEKLNGKVNRTLEIELINNNYTTGTSCTGTCCKGNKKEINLSINKEKPEETCGKGTSDEYIQPPVRPYFFDPRYFGKPAEKRTEAKSVSSSLQLIEEENHPDTNNPSDDDLIQADRLNLSQSFSKTQPQPLDKGKCIEETLGDINPYIRMWLSVLSDYDITVTDDYVDENVLTPLLKAHTDYFSCDDDERYKTTCEIRDIIKDRMEGALSNSYWRNVISMNSDVVSESATAYKDAFWEHLMVQVV